MMIITGLGITELETNHRPLPAPLLGWPLPRSGYHFLYCQPTTPLTLDSWHTGTEDTDQADSQLSTVTFQTLPATRAGH